jgi:F-type H+-transporting ATPase subunit delta
MHKVNHQSPTAIAYAEAMLELANEARSADETGQELRDIRTLVEENDSFAQVLASPAIGAEERGKFLHRIFDGRASMLVMHFLLLANEKARLSLLPSISAAYDNLLERQQGIVEVDVTVAQGLTPQQLDDVRQKVSSTLKREAVVHQYVDPSIIGGVVLRVQDQLIDGSVIAQLSAMRRQLLSAKPT